MEKDFEDFIIKQKNSMGSIDKDTDRFINRLAEISAINTSRITSLCSLIKNKDKELADGLFCASIAAMIMTYSDNFDNSYSLIEETKKFIIHKETEFNKDG